MVFRRNKFTTGIKIFAIVSARGGTLAVFKRAMHKLLPTFVTRTFDLYSKTFLIICSTFFVVRVTLQDTAQIISSF